MGYEQYMDPIETYHKYLKKTPGDRFAMYSLALSLKKAGRIDEAEHAFRQLLAAHPLSGAGHYQHGLLLHEAGRDDALLQPRQAQLAHRDGMRAASSFGTVTPSLVSRRRSFGAVANKKLWLRHA